MMESILRNAQRKFVSEEHIKNVLKGAWVDLFDDYGRKLDGVRGRIGVSSVTVKSEEIGVDLMEMQPDSAFPPHTHPGDHLIYILDGEGAVSIDGIDHKFKKGDTIFIPAEYPHGFKNDSQALLTFIVFGYPHKHLSALDRMKLVNHPPH